MGRFLEENMGAMFPYFQIDLSTMVAAMGLAVGLSVIAAILPPGAPPSSPSPTPSAASPEVPR